MHALLLLLVLTLTVVAQKKPTAAPTPTTLPPKSSPQAPRTSGLFRYYYDTTKYDTFSTALGAVTVTSSAANAASTDVLPGSTFPGAYIVNIATPLYSDAALATQVGVLTMVETVTQRMDNSVKRNYVSRTAVVFLYDGNTDGSTFSYTFSYVAATGKVTLTNTNPKAPTVRKYKATDGTGRFTGMCGPLSIIVPPAQTSTVVTITASMTPC
jgi:hypothetical protein